VSGVRAVTHRETPGLGDYIDPKKDKDKKSPWIAQFSGLKAAAAPVQGEEGRRRDRLPHRRHHQRPRRHQRRGRAARFAADNQNRLFAAPSGSRSDGAPPWTFKPIARSPGTASGSRTPGVVQILGLCPILAISTNIVNAVSLGLATILVMAMANLSSPRCATSSPTRSASRCSS
jgi:hypothetical protein